LTSAAALRAARFRIVGNCHFILLQLLMRLGG
jgi:hypothetical protein